MINRENNLFVLPEEKAKEYFKVAMVHAVHADGLQLIFNGEDHPTQKHYRKCKRVSADPGDRVLCAALSGTFIVIDVIG